MLLRLTCLTRKVLYSDQFLWRSTVVLATCLRVAHLYLEYGNVYNFITVHYYDCIVSRRFRTKMNKAHGSAPKPQPWSGWGPRQWHKIEEHSISGHKLYDHPMIAELNKSVVRRAKIDIVDIAICFALQ